MTRLRGALFLSAIALVCQCAGARSAFAQPPPPADERMEAPAHVSFVDGAATLERDGRPESSPLNMPLLAGDRLRTQNGRVEVLFGDGSILHLDTSTLVDFQSDELVRVLAGRVRLTIPGASRSVSYRIDSPWAFAEIAQSGEYRMGIVRSDRGAEIELAVVRGAAELVTEQGRTPLRAGERAFARESAAPSYAYAFNSAEWDTFDEWSETRRDERLGASAEYLPEDVRPYAPSFERHGSWQYAPSYGHVWYPRVAAGWRPYFNGRWATLRPYGWTWIGADPWAWPTHHYGRWGFSAGAWFWIPGRSWGPAWVSWAYAPGYVSWCPLGWNNRPVIQIVNVWSRGYDPWRAWTVVPQRHFNAGYVNVRGVGRFDLDARTRRSFAPGTRAPGGGYAVPRGSAPIRAAGTGRRSATSPVYTNLEPRDSRIGNAPSRTRVSPSGTLPSEPRGQRSPASSYPDRSGYGRVERSAPGFAMPRDERTYGSAPAPSPRRGTDMGVGGTSPSRTSGRPSSSPAPRAEDAPSRGYGRPATEGRGDEAVGTRRALPRGGADSPASRPSPGEPRARDAAPARPSAPQPRADRPPSRAADRPAAGPPPPRATGHTRPGGAAPVGQARPRGGRGGRD